jgi:hypothetical protein
MDLPKKNPPDNVKTSLDLLGEGGVSSAKERASAGLINDIHVEAAILNLSSSESHEHSPAWGDLLSTKVTLPDSSVAADVDMELAEFNEWFNGSDITDAGDLPMVVYHGSHLEGLDQIIGGWFSADPAVTKEFGKYRYDAFLNIKKPAFHDSMLDSDLVDEYNEMMGTDDTVDMIEIERGISLKDLAVEGGPFTRWLKAKGYDGVSVFDESNAIAAMAYIPFEPQQVKLLSTLSSEALARIKQGDAPTPEQNNRGLTIGSSKEERDYFYRWFQSSKAVDADGKPLVLYRGIVGHKEISNDALAAKPRDRYAVFCSPSPYVSASYANPSDENEVGAVVPIYVKAKKLVEFPVSPSRFGGNSFDKFEFDRRARDLPPGFVLVARNVVDMGPRASKELDPDGLYSHTNDVYAFGSGTETIPAVGAVGPYVGFSPAAPSNNSDNTEAQIVTAEARLFDIPHTDPSTYDTKRMGAVNAAAIAAYKTLSVHARDAVDSWNVNWTIGRLEKAFTANDEIAKEIEQAFAPVKDTIRRVFGDTLTLYRGERKFSGDRDANRTLFSWTMDENVARSYASNTYRLPKRIPDEVVEAAISRYERTGFVSFGSKKYIKNPDDPAYYNIYSGKEMITDGDDIRAELKSTQAFYDELINEAKAKGDVYTTEISLDEIKWIPVGVNLKEQEFIATRDPFAPKFNDIDSLMRDSVLDRLDSDVRSRIESVLAQMFEPTQAAGLTKAAKERLISEIDFSRSSTEGLADAGSNRGPDWVSQRIRLAKSEGLLRADAADFALWAIEQSPSLADDLAISIRKSGSLGTAGEYTSAARMMTLFADKASKNTAVHEMLHHSERLMPAEVQEGIIRAWLKAYTSAWAEGTPKAREALKDMLSMGKDRAAFDRVMSAFKTGTLQYNKHYQLVNASEYWAVNATRLMAKKFEAKGSWSARAKQWLGDFSEKAKGWLGLASDAPILRGLASVLRGTAQPTSARMLVTAAAGLDIGAEISKLESQSFKRWFSGSKVVDENGTPLVVYHGTGADFDEFDPKKSGSNYFGMFGNKGFFFVNTPGTAEVYAEQASGAYFGPGGEPVFGKGTANVMPVYLALKKPYERKAPGSPDKWFDWNMKKLYAAAEKAGADSIIIRGGKGFAKRTIYVALNPNQIKSAIANNGDFSIDDPRITHDISATAQTETPEFKKWFKQSSIVSNEGAPKVVFHATDRDFKVFANPELGYHFAEVEDLAHNAARKGGKYKTKSMPVFLSLENPIEITGQGNGFKFFNLLDDLLERGHLNSDDYNTFMDEYDEYEDTMMDFDDEENRLRINDMTKRVANLIGADGFKYWNEFDSGEGVEPNWSYIALDPKQIKSATLNVGSFNPDSDVITRDIPDNYVETGASVADGLVRNFDNSPLVLYHGSNEYRSTFEPKTGLRYTLGREYEVPAVASFFTPDIDFAESFGDAVTSANLIIKQPLDLREGAWGAQSDAFKILEDHFGESVGLYPPHELWEILDYPVRVNEFKALGYDGVILMERDSQGVAHDTYAVFDGRQVLNAKPHGVEHDEENAISGADLHLGFAHWFGRSQVVEDDGTPRVLYHGTGMDLDMLDPDAKRPNGKRTSVESGIHLTTSPKFASGYARMYDKSDEGEGANVIPVYVSAQKVWNHNDPQALADFKIAYEQKYQEPLPPDVLRYAKDGWWMVVEGTTKILREQFGYDAMRVFEQGIENFIVFESSQVKSAIGNNGDYNSYDNVITHDIPCGESLRAYHGTEHEFDTFKNKGNLGGAMGHWFASTESAAEIFAAPRMNGASPRIIHADITLHNPKTFDGHEEFQEAVSTKNGKTYEERVKSLRRSLIKSGFDGVIIRSSTTDQGGLRDDYVVFDPSAIKVVKSVKLDLTHGKDKIQKGDLSTHSSVKLYHGTNKDFVHFDTTPVYTLDTKRLGAYFSTNPAYAKLYGDTLVEVELAVSKPFDITGMSAWDAIDSLPVSTGFKKELRSAFKGNDYSQYGLLEGAQREGLRDELCKLGYDCIKYTEGYADAYIAFDAAKIRVLSKGNLKNDRAEPTAGREELLPHALVATKGVESSHIKALSVMLEKGGLDPDSVGLAGDCLLAAAIRSDKAEAASLLLTKGASRGLIVSNTNTEVDALTFAKECKSDRCASVIRAHAANDAIESGLAKRSLKP